MEIGLRWHVGNGASISVYNDCWIPRDAGFRPIANPMGYGDELLVSNLIDWEANKWDENMVRVMLHHEDAELVLKLRILEATNAGELIWHH